MRTRLPAALLLAPLLVLGTACGGGSDPLAAPAGPSPTPSPTPTPTPATVVFDVAAVRGALLTAADGPPGYTMLTEEFGGLPERGVVSLCVAPEGVRPPAVPPAPSVSLQGTGGFDSVVETVAVLPDEATAVAVLAAVQRHTARCAPRRSVTIGSGSRASTQTARLSAAVPLVSGQWRGVRQSSQNAFGDSQRWTTQSVVLRRGNAVLDLEVSGETSPPDLAAVLATAVARLDAALPTTGQTGPAA